MATDSKTLTRADLAEAVFQKVGLPRNESAELVESVLREVVACLEHGENVKLSSFGSFSVRDKRERIGRNPKTGDIVPITPRRVIRCTMIGCRCCMLSPPNQAATTRATMVMVITELLCRYFQRNCSTSFSICQGHVFCQLECH